MKTYEGMFLLDAGQSNFEEACQPVRNIMDRHGAECLQMKKWDERRLAYEISGRRRGLYVLTYFKADPQEISGMERDVQLSEEVLRALILSADHVAQDQMDAPTPCEVSTQPKPAGNDSEKDDSDDNDVDNDTNDIDDSDEDASDEDEE